MTSGVPNSRGSVPAQTRAETARIEMLATLITGIIAAKSQGNNSDAWIAVELRDDRKGDEPVPSGHRLKN
jgi:hypothetical protein